MDKIEEVLTRAVENIYPSKKDLEKVLKSGKKLNLYQGFDPTGTQMHIGHMVGLRKLRQFQDLGHHVIFVIGDGTGQAGDPSGKTRSREKFLTNVELRKNAEDYVKQAAKIVRFDGENPVEIRYNGDWLNKLTLPEILDIAGHFSLQQLSERDLFQERMKKGETVNLREFLYPILQGYDSVAMEVDLEIGGSDQLFNMLAGRQLVKEILGKEKYVLTTPLLTDSQGVKIGKTEGNVIALTDEPSDLFGKIMNLSDDVIVNGLEYLTDLPIAEIRKIEKDLSGGQNPMLHKKHLAFEIVKQLSGAYEAQKAQDFFEETFQKGSAPRDLPEITVDSSPVDIVDFLVENNLVESRSQAKRLLSEGALELDGETLENDEVEVSNNQILKIGKKKFVKIKID